MWALAHGKVAMFHLDIHFGKVCSHVDWAGTYWRQVFAAACTLIDPGPDLAMM